MTESMSDELLSRGITVNAIMPSTIDTPQNRQSDPNADFSKWVSAESLADVVAFSELARDSAIQSHKHEKQSEIAIRKMVHKLTNLKHTVSHEDQEQVQRYCELIAQVTGRACEGVVWYVDE